MTPATDAHTPPALLMRAVTKRYGANVALDSVDFALNPGEIHAVLGENGAGKSTLMHVISGLTRPDAGRIEVNGRVVEIAGPTDARRHGIGMVHQHFMLVPSFTVADNLALSGSSGNEVPQRIGPGLRSPALERSGKAGPSPPPGRSPRPPSVPPQAGGGRNISPSPLAGRVGVGFHTLRAVREDVSGRARAVISRLGWDIPLDARAADLPVGAQQRVEIVRALLTDASVLLFDEPTAVLAPTETIELFRVMRTLRDDGKSLIFVSHKLSEVMSLCDRVTVLRHGHVVGSLQIADTSPADLAARMVGADAITADVAAAIDFQIGDHTHPEPTPSGNDSAAGAPTVSKAPLPASGRGRAEDTSPSSLFLQRVVVSSDPAVELDGVCTAAEINAVALRDIGFAVQPGEILGFAGVDGNGQSELAEVLTGMRRWTKGTVKIGGELLASIRTTRLPELGIAYIPPDRHREGLALDLSVEENLLLQAINMPQFRRGPFLRRKALAAYAATLARDFDVRTASLSTLVRSLSGGNQQKIVVARALSPTGSDSTPINGMAERRSTKRPADARAAMPQDPDSPSPFQGEGWGGVDVDSHQDAKLPSPQDIRRTISAAADDFSHGTGGSWFPHTQAVAGRSSRLVVAVSPTRGLDVAATAYIHQRLRECSDAGAAIVLISTELDEVVALSDRIAVLFRGGIAGIVPSDTPRATLGMLMGGGAADA